MPVTVEGGGGLDRIWIASRTPLWNQLLSRSTILIFRVFVERRGQLGQHNPLLLVDV